MVFATNGNGVAAVLALLLLTAWSPVCAAQQSYAHTQQLKDGVTIRWTIAEPSIQLELEVKASGWVGFGLAEAGGMKGADIVYYEKKANKLTDAYGVENVKPRPDACDSDWKLVSSEYVNGAMKVALTRLLVTKDLIQDRPFTKDSGMLRPTPIIMAWGDDEVVSYHDERRVQAGVRFFQESTVALPSVALLADASAFTLLMDYNIPQSVTTYKEHCFDLKALMVNQTVGPQHVIAFEPIISPATAKHVHHYVLSGASSCTSNAMASMSVIWIWAPGAAAQTLLPPEAGIKILSDGGFNALSLQVHYDNPSKLLGLVDKSGFKFYHTAKLRPNDAGILQVGDPLVLMSKKAVREKQSEGFSKLVLKNSADMCTGFFAVDEVTVFDRFLHMHSQGRRMETKQFRGNDLIRTDFVDYYDYSQAGGYSPRSTGSGFKIRKGDTFTVTCNYYDPGGVQFGLASKDEMCIDFIYYYPRQPGPLGGLCIPDSDTLVVPMALQREIEIGRKFGGDCRGSAPSLSSSLLLPLVLAASSLLAVTPRRE